MGVVSTPAQLSFPEVGDKPRKTDRFFFALFPDRVAAQTIFGVARHLRSLYSVRYPTTPIERLHVSLYHVGDFFGAPQGILGKARTAADLVALSPFRAVFDRAKSFERGRGRQPLVLRSSDEGMASMANLYSVLGAALAKQGFEVLPVQFFVPHVTLLRDERVIDEPIEAISWTVREFVLVHRRLTGYDYELIQRWPSQR